MSSDFYAFDTTFHTHSNSSDGVGDLDHFHSDSFPFLPNSPTNVIQEDSNAFPSVQLFSPSFFSFSSPSAHLESLRIYHANRVQPLSNDQNLANEFGSFSAFDGSQVKNEECQMSVDYVYGQQLLPHSYSGAEKLSNYVMQRSFSSNSFEGKPGFMSQPYSDTLLDSPKLQSHDMSSPEDSVFDGQMRKVCSTGDLQANHMSPTEASLLEESNFKVGRYSAEERKEKISKYRAKRTQRNFNKTIKYACRKTLADNRPRIRGRFARNDEASETPDPKASCSIRDEDDDVHFWIEELRLHEQQVDVTVGAEQYLRNYGATQVQYSGF